MKLISIFIFYGIILSACSSRGQISTPVEKPVTPSSPHTRDLKEDWNLRDKGKNRIKEVDKLRCEGKRTLGYECDK